MSSEHHDVKLSERSGCQNVLSNDNMPLGKGQVKGSLCQAEGHHCRLGQILAKVNSASVSSASQQKYTFEQQETSMLLCPLLQ